jgi:hypothetical protein
MVSSSGCAALVTNVVPSSAIALILEQAQKLLETYYSVITC